jgi:hypothetical protein
VILIYSDVGKRRSKQIKVLYSFLTVLALIFVSCSSSTSVRFRPGSNSADTSYRKYVNQKQEANWYETAINDSAVVSSLLSYIHMNRDSIKSFFTQYSTYDPIIEDRKDEGNNYLIAYTYWLNDFSEPKCYCYCYFNEQDKCIKATELLPDKTLKGKFSFYKALPLSRIIDLSDQGIKYAWFSDDTRTEVAYFDPAIIDKFENYFAITYTTYPFVDSKKEIDKQPIKIKKTKKKK